MDGFTLVDGVVAALIVISALLAYSRGFVREAMAIAGWVGSAIVAFNFADKAQPLVKQIPVLGDFIGDSCELSVISAFAAVFAIALVIFSIFTPLLSGMVQRSAANAVDQGMGFLFGVARGIALVVAGFFVYDTILSTQNFAVIDDSRAAAIYGRISGSLDEKDPEASLSWLKTQYEQLVGQCSTN